MRFKVRPWWGAACALYRPSKAPGGVHIREPQRPLRGGRRRPRVLLPKLVGAQGLPANSPWGRALSQRPKLSGGALHHRFPAPFFPAALFREGCALDLPSLPGPKTSPGARDARWGSRGAPGPRPRPPEAWPGWVVRGGGSMPQGLGEGESGPGAGEDRAWELGGESGSGAGRGTGTYGGWGEPGWWGRRSSAGPGAGGDRAQELGEAPSRELAGVRGGGWPGWELGCQAPTWGRCAGPGLGRGWGGTARMRTGGCPART